MGCVLLCFHLLDCLLFIVFGFAQKASGRVRSYTPWLDEADDDDNKQPGDILTEPVPPEDHHSY